MDITLKLLNLCAMFSVSINKIDATNIKKSIDKVEVQEEHVIVTDSELFPYMVAIFKKSTFISSGALIDENWVLTGADSLFTIRESSRILRVRLGSLNYKKGGYLTPIKYLEIHPYFDDSKPLFDIALIKLAEPVRLTQSLNPIRLQEIPRKVAATHFIVTAWPLYQLRNPTVYRHGTMELTKRRILTVSHLHPTDPYECYEELEMLAPDHNNTNTSMCLDPIPGSDHCQKDIGAPVVLNGILWGIMSSWKSEDCDIEGGLSFVTLVSALEVSSWIHSTIHGHKWTKKHIVDYDDNYI